MSEIQPPLDDRKASVLRAVVEAYIETAQPVGSGHVARSSGVNVSPATVRNEMALLEQDGYLFQPHTSAGRVPTEKGYRFFVDAIDAPGRLGSSETHQVRSFFARAHGELEQMLADTSRLLSGLTQYTALVVAPPNEVVPEPTVPNVYIGGTSHTADAFDAVATVREVLRILEEQLMVVTLLKDVVDRGLNVAIGTETGIEPLADCSVVVAPYEVGGEVAGSIGVLGPTRMHYPQAMAAVAVVSKRLGDRLSETQP